MYHRGIPHIRNVLIIIMTTHRRSLPSRMPISGSLLCQHISCSMTPTHSKWPHPLPGGEVKAPEVVEGCASGRASTKDVHGLVEIACAVREAISDGGALFVPDVGPDHLTGA